MSDTSHRYSIQTSVEHLSLNFDKLENIHYGLLAKVQEEKDIKTRKRDNVSPGKTYNNDTKKYTKEENGFERLENIKKAYNHEINNLKNLLFRQSPYSNGTSGPNESLAACQNSIESSLNSLLERVFTIEEIKRSGKPILKKIETYFEQTMKDVELSFSHINHLTDRENSSKDNIEKIINLCHINSTAFKEIGDVTSSIKKKIVHSFNEMTTYSISYDKEAQSLQLYLNQATAQFEDLVKRLGTITQSSFAKLDDNEVRKITNIVGELLTQANSVDTEKNKLFMMTKKQTENTYKKMMGHLKDIICKVEKSNYTNEGVGGIAVKERGIEKDSNIRTRSPSPGQVYNSKDTLESTGLRSSPSPLLDLREEISKMRSKSPSEISTAQVHSRLFRSQIDEWTSSKTNSPTRLLLSIKEPSSPIEQNRERYSQSSDNLLLNYVVALSRIGLNLKISGRNLANTMKIALDSPTHYNRSNDVILRNLHENKETFENQLGELLQIIYKINSTQPSHSTPVHAVSRQDSPTNTRNWIDETRQKMHSRTGSINLAASAQFVKEDAIFPAGLTQSCLSPVISGHADETTKPKIKSLSPLRDVLHDPSSLKDENKRLVQEYSNIVKVAKKLETKAEERKRNLKEVFAILTEKDNELKRLKTQEKIDIHTHFVEVEDLIRIVENQLEDKYRILQAKLNEKDNRMKDLEEKIVRLNNRRGSPQTRSPPSLSPQNIHDILSPANRESRIQSRALEMSKIFEKSDPKEANMKNLENKIIEIKKEKRELEEKYNNILKEFERSQDHKKKIEANYQEEVKILNDKIAQLQSYGDDLEKKYTKKLKQVISPGRSPKASSIMGEFSPINRDEKLPSFEDVAESIKNKQKAIGETIEKILQELGGDKESYRSLGQLDRVERILSIIQEGNNAGAPSNSHTKSSKLIGMIEDKLRAKSSSPEIDLLKKQNSDLELSFKSLKAELEEKTQENKDLNSLLLIRNHERKTFESEQQETDRKEKELVGKYEKLHKEKEQLDEELEGLCRQLSGIYQRYGLIDKQLTNKISYLAEAFKTLETRLEGFKKKDENNANINSKIEALIKEHNTKQEILKQRINDLEENDFTLNQKLRDLAAKSKEKELQIVLLTERLDESENNKNSRVKEIEQLNVDKQNLETELFKINEEKGFLERKLQRDSEESNQLKRNSEDIQETIKRSYEGLKEKMQKEIEEHKNRISELQREMTLLKTEKGQLEKVKSEQDRANKNILLENEHLKTLMKDLKENADNSKNELQGIIKRLEEEAHSLNIAYERLQNNLDSKELDIKRLTEELKRTEHEENQKSIALLKLSKEVETTKLSNTDLSEKIKDKERNVSRLSHELDSLKTRKSELETELRKVKEDNKKYELEKTIETFKNESASQVIIQESLKNQLTLKNTEIQNLEAKLREIEYENKLNSSSFGKDKQSFEEELKKKDQELDNIKVQLSARDEKLKAEVNKFEQEKETIKMDLKKNIEINQIQLQKAQDHSLSLKKTLEKQQDDISEKDSRIKQLAVKIQDLESRLEAQKLQMEKSGASRERSAFSLANSVESVEVQTQDNEPKKEEISGPIWNHLRASETKRNLEEEMRVLQNQLEELKKEKSIIQNEYNQTVQEKAAIIQEMNSEIGTLKTSIVVKDSELSNIKQTQSLEASKIREESEKKIFELEKLLQVMKEHANELAKEPEILRQELAKSKLENEGLKKISSFESSPLFPPKAQSFQATDGDLSPLELHRSPSIPDNLKKENKKLKEEKRHLKDENVELRNSMLVFQEQVVSLNETMKTNQINSQELISTMKKSLLEILELETLQGRITVKLDTLKEAQETMAALKQALQENEEDMLTLVKELEEYDKKKDEIEEFKEKLVKKEGEMNGKITEANEILKEGRKRIREEVEFLDNNMNERLMKINAEIETMIKEYTIADLPEEAEKLRQNPSLLKTEKVIYSNLTILKEYIEMAVEIQDNYEKLVLENKKENGQSENPDLSTVRESEENNDDQNEDEEKKENPVTKEALQRMKEVSLWKKKNVQQEDDSKSSEIHIGKDTPRSLEDPSLHVGNEGPPTFQEVDDQPDQILSAQNDNELQSVKQQMRALLDQLRTLQDSNEKLQDEYKQLEHDYNMLKFIRDELKSEINDKDEKIRDLELKATESLPTFGGKEREEPTFEREHLKTMFVKFIQNALKGNVEGSVDILRTLLSLLYVSEDVQTQILNDFKQKSSKKGVFNRLFK